MIVVFEGAARNNVGIFGERIKRWRESRIPGSADQRRGTINYHNFQRPCYLLSEKESNQRNPSKSKRSDSIPPPHACNFGAPTGSRKDSLLACTEIENLRLNPGSHRILDFDRSYSRSGDGLGIDGVIRVEAMPAFRMWPAQPKSRGSRFLRHVERKASLRYDSECSSRFQKAMKGGIPYSGSFLLSLASEKEE